MGNCNFKPEQETDNVTGKLGILNKRCLIVQKCPILSDLISNLFSNNKKPFLVSLCHWQRRLWQSMES